MTSAPSPSDPRPALTARGRLVPVTLAIAAGIAAAAALPGAPPAAWLTLAGAAAGGSGACGPALRRWLLLLACLAVGAARGHLAEFRGPAAEVTGWPDGARVVADLQLRSDLVPEPAPRAPALRFAPQRPTAVADADWLAWTPPGGTPRPLVPPPQVRVHVEADAITARRGDRLRVAGRLEHGAPPANPGARDRRPARQRRGAGGSIVVEQRGAIERLGAPDAPTPSARRAAVRQVASRAVRWRDDAAAALLDGAPSSDPRRRALLAAIALGRRDAGTDAVVETFRTAGLAHVVALSGLHLALVIGMLYVAARRVIRAPVALGAVVLLATVAFLTIVDVRVPVLRAGVLSVLAAVAVMTGRRFRADGLLALTALLLLWWRPGQLFEAGFQLSFGVVAALVVWARAVDHRLFGTPPPGPSTLTDRVRRALTGTIAASITASLIATPLAAHHFGTLTPWTIPLTVIALPIVAVVLALAYGRLLVAPIGPAPHELLGALLAHAADVLDAVVSLGARLPGATCHVPPPSIALTAALLGCAWWWLAAACRHSRRGWLARSVVTVALLLTWARGAPTAAPFTLTTLAVGDGTCHVVQSDGACWLIDAGSLDPRAGARIVVPALRALGVRRIDAFVITHANFDHYSAGWAVLDAFPVSELIVTAPFPAAAAEEPDGAPADLLRHAGARAVRVTTAARGAVRHAGRATITWLHPGPDDHFEDANDGSAALRLTVGTRTIVLTGDLETDGLAAVRAAHPALRADVLELPHHGSWIDAAPRFVRACAPALLIQSTGSGRLDPDRWRDVPALPRRLITARDGAITLTIDHDDTIRATTFRGQRVVIRKSRPSEPPRPSSESNAHTKSSPSGSSPNDEMYGRDRRSKSSSYAATSSPSMRTPQMRPDW